MTDKPSISDALRLRQWALHALVGVLDTPPASGLASWQIFLRMERCASQLKARLVAQGLFEQLRPHAQEQLSATARRELQKVLCVRAQLRLLDEIAARHGWTVVVLKGAVAALRDSTAVDLGDLDILVPPQEAQALAAALEDVGYRASGGSNQRHLKGRVAEGELEIEIHTVTDAADPAWSGSVWNRLIPVDGTSRSRQLAPPDHLWHVLTHVVVYHRFRSGAIRDLLLIRDAVAACCENELGEVSDRIESHQHADALRDVLWTAVQLRGNKAFVDRYVSQAAVLYYLDWQANRLALPQVLRGDVGSWAFSLLQPKTQLRHSWDNIWTESLGRSQSPLIARLEQKAPLLGRVMRVASRMGRAAMAMVYAVPLAVMASFVARRATRSLAR